MEARKIRDYVQALLGNRIQSAAYIMQHAFPSGVLLIQKYETRIMCYILTL